MTRRVLCVDDEPNLLDAFERQLRKTFEVETALGPERGLEAVAKNGPYAVVMSDLRMPKMDGIQFLSKVRQSEPDTVRIVLTGQADLRTAIAAVNEGNVFQFLTKPCPPEFLNKALESAIRQYGLIIAERELLESTLKGAVKVLTEILSLVNPSSFSRAHRIRAYVAHMASKLGLPETWQFEMAALLSQIGCIAVPADVLDKVAGDRELSEDERDVFTAHPTVAYQLLEKIPRLEVIARMIRNQQQAVSIPKPGPNLSEDDQVVIGGEMIRTAMEFDRLVSDGFLQRPALRELQRVGNYSRALLQALETVEVSGTESVLRILRVPELQANMVINEDIWANNGALLVPKGQEVTYSVIARLKSFASTLGVKEPFSVLVPTDRVRLPH